MVEPDRLTLPVSARSWGPAAGGPGSTALLRPPAMEELEPRVLLATAPWQVFDTVTADDGAALDWFGWSVAVDGDYAVVGARYDDHVANSAGSAYVFHREGDAWVQQDKLTASDAAEGDWFGEAVAISGDYAIVGCRHNPAFVDSGSAYVFHRSGTSWTQQDKLFSPPDCAYDAFGRSVSISGDYAIVGAFADDTAADGAGAAYVYRRDGATWTQDDKLTASDAAAFDFFGYSVSICGNYAVVGAIECNVGGQADAGAAYVFYRGAGGWTEHDKLFASDPAEYDGFGSSVAIWGDHAVVGAWANDQEGADAGAAYVFHRNGADWPEEQKLTASDAGEGDWFGTSVAGSGDRLVVGSYGAIVEGNYACGAAYVFYGADGAWRQEGKLVSSGSTRADQMGLSVSISGSYVIAGAYTDDDLVLSSELATIFHGAPVPRPVPCAQNFSSGKPLFGDGWDYYSTSEGRISAITGQLRMFNDIDLMPPALNEAILHLNLAGWTGVTLTFDHVWNGDDSHLMPQSFVGHANADGVAVSADGVNWYRLTDLTGSFAGQSFDLDLAIRRARIHYSSDFQIKFQQFDDCSWTYDGRAFDNIVVTARGPRHSHIARFYIDAQYLAMYPDVAAAVAGGHFAYGFDHFIYFGLAEGRDPSCYFRSDRYRASNPDVAAAVAAGAFRSVFEHYVLRGAREGRNPSTFFDERYYLAQYPDVGTAIGAGTFLCGLDHYLRFGAGEGRCTTFNEQRYLALYPDVNDAVVGGAMASGRWHYLRFGAAEGRSACPFFREDYYLCLYADVAAAVAAGAFRSGLEHLIRFGQFEGRLAAFDEARYLSMYPDVQAAVAAHTFASGLQHFIIQGHAQGRNPCPYFIEAEYLATYPDVAGAVAARQFASGLEHYLLFGQFEGRSPRA